VAKKVTKTSKTGITKGRGGKTKTSLKKTRIAIVMDRSGSMSPIRKEAVAMFNDQIKAIKKNSKGLDTKVTFVTFSTTPDKPLVFNEGVDKLKKLSDKDFVPNGWTAMYDAVGHTVDSLATLPEYADENCSFLVIIISDGQENYSREYNAVSMSERIRFLQGTGRWTFSYLGANQDLAQVARTLHIPVGNTYGWITSSVGATLASSVNSSATTSYLHGVAAGQTASVNFYQPDTTSGTGNAANTVATIVTGSTTTDVGGNK
jgi:hypothetical protein